MSDTATHTLVYVRGTWEADPGLGGELFRKLEALRPGKYRFHRVDYPAVYSDTMPYDRSRHIGEQNTIRAIREDELPVVLVGYSQGADVAGAVARRASLDPALAELEISGVGLIADPRRHRGQIYGPDHPAHEGPHFGITGERWIPEVDGRPLWSMVVLGDGITDLPEGNPLRSLADLSAMFSSNPKDLWSWLADVGLKVARGQMQDWWDPRKRAGWLKALQYANDYARGGRHTDAYFKEGHVDRLAAAIAEQVD